MYWPWPGCQFPGVVGQYLVDEIHRLGARAPTISPMCEMSKIARRRAHGPVLLNDAGVAKRHLPAAELDQVRPEPLVRRMQWCFLEHVVDQPHFSVFICALGIFNSSTTSLSADSTKAFGPQA